MAVIVDNVSSEDTDQMREELAVMIRALGHTLLSVTRNFAAMAMETRVTGVLPTSGASALRDFGLLDQVMGQLSKMGVDIKCIAAPAVIEIMRERGDQMGDEEIEFMTKLANNTLAGCRHAATLMEADEVAVTSMAEKMIATRAAIGDYTVEQEIADYAFSRSFVYGLRAQSKDSIFPKPVVHPTYSEADVDARVAALV
jgi:hypothetical protein